ncbi:MAG: thioredoxin family protein [Nitrososphaerales archaeon]|nr:thioredoxin family protein [Nitrososphaerales archaeon]
MPHRIQIFSGGCRLCEQAAEIIEVGKCKDCVMETLDVRDSKNGKLMRHYAISSVPSIVIDGRIKVAGVPDFPWFCGDEFYKILEGKYPLKRR